MSHVPDEPVRGSVGDRRAFQRPGLETMRRFVRGGVRELDKGRRQEEILAAASADRGGGADG